MQRWSGKTACNHPSSTDRVLITDLAAAKSYHCAVYRLKHTIPSQPKSQANCNHGFQDSALQHGHSQWPEDRSSAGRNGPRLRAPHHQHPGTFTPEFIKLNPNSKIPVIIDPDGPDGKPITIVESGAILLYHAEKSGKFLSTNPRHRWETIQWLMFQMAGVGPMFGQFGHFLRSAKEKCKDPCPTERYGNEATRLLGVLEKRLEGRDFVVDDGYSIADMALFPWIRAARGFYADKLEFQKFPLVNAWVERCYARPASAKGTTVCFVPY